jgi:hypothetical protein
MLNYPGLLTLHGYISDGSTYIETCAHKLFRNRRSPLDERRQIGDNRPRLVVCLEPECQLDVTHWDAAMLTIFSARRSRWRRLTYPIHRHQQFGEGSIHLQQRDAGWRGYASACRHQPEIQGQESIAC